MKSYFSKNHIETFFEWAPKEHSSKHMSLWNLILCAKKLIVMILL